MQPTDPLTTIFQHNLWANLTLLEHCAQLSSEQLEARIEGTYGTIQEMLEHIVGAELSYFTRISTGKPYRRSTDAPPHTLDMLRESARLSGEGLIEWAPKVQAGDQVEVQGDDGPHFVPKSIILTQVINHATEHRAQIMATMTQIGVEPPDLQSWAYFDALRQADSD